MVTEAVETATFQLDIPLPKMLTLHEELALSRKAWERSPDSSAVRLQFARMLVILDHFDEAIERLRAWDVDDYRFLDQLSQALVSRETTEDDLAAREVCQRQIEIADSDVRRSSALTKLAKLQIRLDQFDEARRSLEEALALDRGEKDAYKRVTALDFRDGRPQDIVEHAERMVAEGVAHSRVIASQSLALARLGMIEEARRAQGLEEFLVQFDPAPPPGWASLAEFSEALGTEIASHPDIRYERYGVASAKTWRVDEPALRRTRVFPQLQQLVRREVERYVQNLPPGEHPFLQGRPARAELRNWCVITEGDGHETWHVHQNGWLSGVFYPYVQDHIAQGTGVDGCIAFGLPEGIVGEENARAFGEVVCRPRTGLMMIFPSHTFHRTFPHHGDGRRICYAFDIIPRLASAETF